MCGNSQKIKGKGVFKYYVKIKKIPLSFTNEPARN
jgi:hypothetical protein